MTALPAVLAHPAPLRLVGLSAAAQEAIDATPEEIIRRWLLGLSDSARRSYRRAIHRFAAWAMPSAEPSPEAAMRLLVTAGPGPAREMVVRWRDELLQQGLAPGSVCCLTTGIASLVKACRRAGLIGWALEAVAPRYERRQDRSGPRRHQVEALFATIDEQAAAGDRQAVRDAALLRLLYVAALRRSEAVGLRVEDLDLQHPDDGPAPRPARRRPAHAHRRRDRAPGADPAPLAHGHPAGTDREADPVTTATDPRPAPQPEPIPDGARAIIINGMPFWLVPVTKPQTETPPVATSAPGIPHDPVTERT